MSLVSLLFVCFLALVFLFYYLVPGRWQWIVLLSSSLIFYASYDVRYLLFILAASLITWLCGRREAAVYAGNEGNHPVKTARPAGKSGTGESAGKSGAEKSAGTAGKSGAENRTGKGRDREADRARKALQKKQCRRILTTGVVLLLAMLAWSKAGNQIVKAVVSLSGGKADAVSVLVPLGISYYTFSAIGYLADIYWRKDEAETSYPRLLLYLIYFPHILQGPIPRHRKLAQQLSGAHKFDYTQFCFGLQRMAWGWLKKTVVADRFGVMVSAILTDYQNMSGVTLFLGILLSAVQLYADFSGCMDIVIGISQSLGIVLDENFQQPFFSKSAAEFWRRWHITLGSWFKDYVYMPLVVSPRLMKLSRKVKDKHGRKAARDVITIAALAVVWLLTGLWHGTGPDYILWGCYWGVLIICGTVFSAEYAHMDEKLHINPHSRGWQRFQMVRTFLIYCGGRLLTAPGSLKAAGGIVAAFFTRPYVGALRDGTLLSLGLDRADLIVGGIGIGLIWAVDLLKEHGVNIRESIARWKLPARWAIYYGVILFTAICGQYGPAFNGGSFIYAGF